MNFAPLAQVLNTPLYGETLLPPRAAAVLIIVHGIGEHGGRYQSAMRSLANRGIACFVFDQRGHGRSPGRRTDIDSFGQLADDFRAIVQGVRRAQPDLPLFLWAHSMGSLVALLAVATLTNEVSGITTSGCPIAAYARSAPWLLPPLRLLSRVAPLARVSSVLGAQQLTHDLAVQRAFAEDPLVERSATLRLLVGLADARSAARESAGRLKLPWLAVHGGDDRIAPPQGSQELIDLLASEDKRLVVYPGLRHEVHNEVEPGRSQFLDTLAQWVLDRSAR